MADSIEGVRPVVEAIRAGRRAVLEIRLPERDRTPGLRELRELAREHEIPILPGRGGVTASAEPYPEEALEDLLIGPSPRRLVALDRVTDVGNLGSIARSAETAGITGLILELRHAPPIQAGALRASAGALEHLRVGRTPNLRKGLALARSAGMTVLAADSSGGPLSDVPSALLGRDLVFVFGSEDRGLREGVREEADYVVGISTHGAIASLGVAAAAAFLLHLWSERVHEV
jgi:23S rRNA (guanosine2251-2'-O)-methyltransferase